MKISPGQYCCLCHQIRFVNINKDTNSYISVQICVTYVIVVLYIAMFFSKFSEMPLHVTFTSIVHVHVLIVTFL